MAKKKEKIEQPVEEIQEVEEPVKGEETKEQEQPVKEEKKAETVFEKVLKMNRKTKETEKDRQAKIYSAMKKIKVIRK